MKRKFLVAALLIVMSFCLVLTGCSKKKKLAKYYQDELGMSKDEAEEWAGAMDELFGDGEEEEPEEEENVSDFILVEPSAEIKNSKLNDPIIQIYNAVLRTDCSMTLEECINEIQKDFEDSLYEVGVVDLNMDALQKEGSSSVTLVDKNDQVICCIGFVNVTNAPVRVGDCKVYAIREAWLGGNQTKHGLNIFYAGNICPGVYNASKEVKESAEYQERIIDYPLLTYNEIPQYLESLGYKNVIFGSVRNGIQEDCYGILFFNPDIKCMMGEEEIVKCGEIQFRIDMSTATCDFLNYNTSHGKETELYSYEDDFTYLSEEEFLKVEERGKEWLPNDNGGKLAASVKIGGYNGSTDYLIYLLNDGTYFYERLHYKIKVLMNGDVEFELDPYRSNSTGSAASLDEMANALGCSVSDFVMAK